MSRVVTTVDEALPSRRGRRRGLPSSVPIGADDAPSRDTDAAFAAASAEWARGFEPDEDVPSRRGAALDVRQISDPPTGSLVEPGQTITFTLIARNSGDVNLNVLLVDDLTQVLDEAILVADTMAATIDGLPAPAAALLYSRLVWTGPLPARQALTVVYQVTVGRGARDGDLIANAVTATGVDPNAPWADGTGDCSNFQPEFDPDLAMPSVVGQRQSGRVLSLLGGVEFTVRRSGI